MSEPIHETYPVLPLRDVVVFPHIIMPLFVGREKSVSALEAVMQEDQQIVLASQKDPSEDNPTVDTIYDTGVLASVLQLLKLPDGTVKVLVEGQSRIRITEYVDNDDFFEARIEGLKEIPGDKTTTEALLRSVSEEFEKFAKIRKNIPEEALSAVAETNEPAKLADIVAGHLGIEVEQKQELLETLSVSERLEKLYGLMQGEMSVLQVEKKIKTRVKSQMERTQREYYLNEQMKAIQRELGEGEDGKSELDELGEQINEAGLPKEAREKVEVELKKLRNMGPMSAEATVVRNYLDWMTTIPWKKASRVNKDIKKAREILDADHFGLDKVKDRIVEFLAVQKRTRKIKGPILCLVGPPGVGKTSLGKSIARASGREYVRMALGGVRDEAEIRGHRRTYIGSMPGKIIQGMKKAGKKNPLFLLDEIDKLGSDWRGDPSSALLEVLDPAQNSTFQDHYLEVDFDLSNVMFITTANSLNMPQPLMDRMEIIRLSGYTENEKKAIAFEHLIPRQIKEHGLTEGEIEFTEQAVIDIIRYFTREAGVRSLEREIAKIARKAITKIVSKDTTSVKVDAEDLGELLGVKKFRYGEIDAEDQVGVVTGLAWTEVGGELLQVESVKVPGKGKVSATGKLGDVMKESIQAAEFFIKSRANTYGIDLVKAEKTDIHVHVPEGGTPKDGPSAGVAMVTSIVSAQTGIAVRKDVAMTGEITLRGRVLAIGGLKEKLLAALRGGIKTVLIPKENEKDLAEVPDNVKDGLDIIPISLVDEALNVALIRSFDDRVNEDEVLSDTPLAPGNAVQEDLIAH